MKLFFQRLLNAGIDPELTYQETRTVSFLNGLVLLVLLLIILNIPLPLLEVPATPGGKLLIAILIIHWIMIAFTLGLNFLKKFIQARIFFGFVAASFMTIYTAVMGIETRWSFFLPIIIFLQFYMFPAKEKLWMYVISIYCAICFSGLEFWFMHHQPLADYPASFILHFKYFNSFGFLFCAGAMGLVGYNTINRAEKKLA